jgi:hypothetical protein
MGGLPFFANKEVDNPDEYFEATLRDDVEEPTPAAPSTLAPAGAGAAAAEQLRVEGIPSLKVKDLKEELRKRGRSNAGKKAELQAQLREAIINNVPVAVGNEPPRHESMLGLDVMLEWVLLTPKDEPFSQPVNDDASLRTPTEMDGVTNPKFALKEKFVRDIFSGTNKKMKYANDLPSRPPKKRARKGRKLLPTRQQVVKSTKPRVKGGPNADFLKQYGLNENSYPIYWFLALSPMTQAMNLEDPVAANVKGNKTIKFSVSVVNWTVYSNTKAMMCNAGEPGSIYLVKFKPFKNDDILAMISVYIIDGLVPSPQLAWKMQDQERQPTHDNDRIAAVIGLVGNKSTAHFVTSLRPRIP